MSVEPVDQVILLWETSRISAEQAIGKILLLLQAHQKELLKLAAAQNRLLNELRSRRPTADR